MIRQFFYLLDAWWNTREVPRPFLLLFTVMVFCGLTGFLFVASSRSPAALSDEYRQAAQQAFQADDLQVAELLFRKVVWLGDRTAPAMFQLGLLAEKSGNTKLAVTRMESIAPADGLGYADAHIWLANYFLSQPLDPTTRDLARHHLESACLLAADNSSLHARLAPMYLAEGNPERAEPHLKAAVGDYPDLGLPLARIRAAAGSRAEAVTISERAASQFQKRLESNPPDVEARLKLAELRTFLEQWHAAEQLLTEGLRLSQDDRFKHALAKVYAFRADLFQRDEPGRIIEQLSLLEAAVRLSPDDMSLAQRFARFLTLPVPLSKDALILIRNHSHAILQREATNRDAHYWLAQVALRENQAEQAIEHLEQLVVSKAEQPVVSFVEQPVVSAVEQALVLARLYRLQQDDARATELAAQAERTFAARVAAEPLNVQQRLLYAESLAFRLAWTESVAVLAAGIDLDGVSEESQHRLLNAQSMIYSGWAESLQKSPAASAEQRIGLLIKAIQLAPTNLTAYDQLGKMIESGSDDEVAAVKVELERLLARGKSSGAGHMILGGVAVRKNDLAAARLHFEQAHRAMPDAPECLNNLAWVLTRSEPKDANRALDLINKALDRQPLSPEFLETRGEILLELDRPVDAIADLEKTLQTYPERQRTHQLLSDAYARTGSEEIARQHLELSGAAN